LADGKVSGRTGFNRIGLLAAEEGSAVVLVALRVTTGDAEVGTGDGAGLLLGGLAELVEEVQEVIGILAGSIDANDKGDSMVALHEILQAPPELAVARGRFGEWEFRGRRLKVFAEEGGVVAVARGVDADADADGKECGGGRWGSRMR
jgi:hypothetical protein